MIASSAALCAVMRAVIGKPEGVSMVMLYRLCGHRKKASGQSLRSSLYCSIPSEARMRPWFAAMPSISSEVSIGRILFIAWRVLRASEASSLLLRK